MSEFETEHCYILFDVADQSALDRLIAVVDRLKTQMQVGSEIDNGEWLSLFEKEDREIFWWPTSSEKDEWWRFWNESSVEIRMSPDMPKPPWDFGSMIEVICTSEYHLVGIRLVECHRAALEFSPHSYPYGGTESLRTLISAFGHRVIGFEDGTGFEQGNPVSRVRWKPGMRPMHPEKLGLLKRLFS